MDVRSERIPLLWSTVRKKHWPKVKISFQIWRTKYLYVCRRMKLTGRGVHSEKVGERGRR